MEAELAMGFRTLAGIGPAVSIFGSARTQPDSPEYALARATAAALGRREVSPSSPAVAPASWQPPTAGPAMSGPCRSG